jgi:hypothetical protein
MNICILGDSSVAAIKNGWDKIKKDHPQHQLIFFASPHNKLCGLGLKGSVLVPQNRMLTEDIKYTSGGHSCVGLNDYDAILILGMGLNIPSIDTRYSNAVINQIFNDSAEKSLNIQLCKKIQTVFTRTIYLAPTPQRASISRARLAQYELNYFDAIKLAQTKFAVNSASIVAQPHETIVDDWFTKKIYSIGSQRLAVSDSTCNQYHEDTDDYHMNESFGQLWLNDFLKALE